MLTQIIKQTLPISIIAGTLLFSPLVKAENPIKNIAEIPTSQTLIAQEDGGCGTLSTFVVAQTRRYYIYICGGDNPSTYIGIAKNGSGQIELPLASYTRDRFVANNRNTRYTVTRGYLTVTQKGKVILKERIISWN